MFIRNVFSYSMANTYSQTVRIAQEFIVRIILPPEVLGIWSFALIVMNFGITFDLGVLDASLRELSLCYGGHKIQQATEYRYTAFCLHLVAKVVVAVAIIIYLLYRYRGDFSFIFWAGIAAAWMVILASIGEAFISFYQSSQRYVELSKYLIIYWTVYAVVMVFGAWFWGVLGLIVASLFVLLFQAWLMRGGLLDVKHDRYRPSLTQHAAKSLLSFAIPFRVVDYPMNFLQIADTLVVTKFLSLKILAIYMTGKLILNQAGQVPAWIGAVFVIRLNMLAGSGKKSRKELGQEALSMLLIQYLIILPVFIVLVMIVSQFVVVRFLPKYVQVIDFLPILLMALYFLPRVTNIRNFWMIDKKFKFLGISNLIGLLMMMLGFFGIWFEHGITLHNVALVFLASYAVYFLYVALMLGKELWSLKQLVELFVYLLLSMLLVLFALNVGKWTFLKHPFLPWRDLMVGGFWGALLILPLVCYGFWKTGLMNHFYDILK